MPKPKRPKLRDIPAIEVSREHYRSKPLFGQVQTNAHGRLIATVRNDLAPRVKKHVKLHERVHIKYGGGEIKTNLISGLIDPVGFTATTIATVRDKERRKYYLRKIRDKFRRKK